MGDRVRQGRESARPMPPPGSPNVLLVVMDTVAAGHLSLHGYGRPTSTTLVELADRGVRFDSARAASLMDASVPRDDVHRSMDARALGRLADPARRDASHARGVPRRAGLRDRRVRRQYLVLCDRLGAGSRLHSLPRFQPPRAHGIQDGRAGQPRHGRPAGDRLTSRRTGWSPPACFPTWSGSGGRWRPIARARRRSIASSSAGSTSRPEPGRPFFAFLNYFDAHYPYQLPPGRLHRFGVEPSDDHQRA